MKREDLKPGAAAFSKVRAFILYGFRQDTAQAALAHCLDAVTRRVLFPAQTCKVFSDPPHLISKALYLTFKVLGSFSINIFSVIYQNLWRLLALLSLYC